MSRIDGITCSTIELGVKIPRPLLETTTYSDGITFPKFKPRDNPSPDGSHSPAAKPRDSPSSSSRSADGFTKPLDPTTFFRWRETVVPAHHPPV